MRRLVLVLVSLGVIACVAAQPAGADKKFAPGCGASGGAKTADAWSLDYESGHFHGEWIQVCGVGPVSVEIEVQRTTDGGNHWNDVVAGGGTFDIIVPTSDSAFQHRQNNWPQSACGSGSYRFKVYDANHSSVAAMTGGC